MAVMMDTKNKMASLKERYRNKESFQKKILIFSFMLIPMVLLILFTYVPLINMIGYSFTSWNGFSPEKKFVGLKNYVTIFTTPRYFEVFKVSVYYFFATFFQMGIALFFATILSKKIRGGNFFKGVLFFPYLINGVAIAFTFILFFKPEGTLDSLLALLGLKSFVQTWLGDPSIINYSLAATSVWRYMGFNLVIFIGAIQSIPSEIYEAAELDGANAWQQFKYIILPSIKKIIQLNLLLAINGCLSVFEIPYIMTGGSNGSKTFVIQTVETAFKFNKVGLASAMAIVLLFIVLIVGFAQKIFFKDEKAV